MITERIRKLLLAELPLDFVVTANGACFEFGVHVIRCGFSVILGAIRAFSLPLSPQSTRSRHDLSPPNLGPNPRVSTDYK